MSNFEQYQRVYIIKPDDRVKYSKIDEAYVVDFTDEGDAIVEFRYQFMKHLKVFKDEELKAYVR